MGGGCIRAIRVGTSSSTAIRTRIHDICFDESGGDKQGGVDRWRCCLSVCLSVTRNVPRSGEMRSISVRRND